MKSDTAEGVAIAQEYYDSDDAVDFYSQVWGGEDIHVGLYDSTDDIRTASRLTVDRMVSKVAPLEGKSVIDLGSGYGGGARVLAGEHGASVTCNNIARVENARNRELTQKAGLADKIEAIDASFDDLPVADASYDVAWSQDAILHAPDRGAVLDEVARVLKPGGLFVFTDPMQADDLTDLAAMQPIYDRIHLPDLASIGFYKAELEKRGFETVEIEELTGQLGKHYARVRAVMLEKQQEFGLSDAFVERMAKGLSHWVDGAAAKRLSWAIMTFSKKG